jgi:hypothetical protein
VSYNFKKQCEISDATFRELLKNQKLGSESSEVAGSISLLSFHYIYFILTAYNHISITLMTYILHITANTNTYVMLRKILTINIIVSVRNIHKKKAKTLGVLG